MNITTRPLLVTAIAAAFALTGCDTETTPADVAETRMEQREEVAETVRDNVAEVREERSETLDTAVEARREIALAQAEADYEIAMERCEMLDAEAHDLCEQQAEEQLEAARTSVDRVAYGEDEF